MAITPWTAGQRVTAARLAAITPVWAAWTPTWTTTTGVNTPSYGNASLECEYCQTGDLVICRVQIVFGTTTSFGGGTAADNWQFSLPVAAASTSNAAGHMELSINTNDRRYGRVRLLTTTTFGVETSTGSVGNTAAAFAGLIDSVTPLTWASGNGLYGSLQYKAA